MSFSDKMHLSRNDERVEIRSAPHGFSIRIEGSGSGWYTPVKQSFWSKVRENWRLGSTRIEGFRIKDR
jgi:hypothetical protein